MKKSASNKCKYDCYDAIPAKVFFDILESKDLQLLKPKPGTSTEWLEQVFSKIYDDYFKHSEDKDAQKYLFLSESKELLERKIIAFKLVLAFHWNTPAELWQHPTIIQIRKEQIEAINEYLDQPFDVEGDFLTEFEKTINISIGIMKMELMELEMEMDSIKGQSDGKAINFYKTHSMVNKINAPYILPSNVLLPEYVEAKKQAIQQQLKSA